MVRHLARLADETFDAVVVGGVIYGLSAAHALVQRGLSVALIERRDFGGATSFNSLKTVHGGIRSLQHGSLAAGRHPLTWDGRDARGSSLANGVYFVRAMTATYGSQVKRIVKVR